MQTTEWKCKWLARQRNGLVCIHVLYECARPDETHFESSYVLNGWIVDKNLISNLMRCIALQWHDHIAVAVVRFDMYACYHLLFRSFLAYKHCANQLACTPRSCRLLSNVFTFVYIYVCNHIKYARIFALFRACEILYDIWNHWIQSHKE